MKKNRRLTSIAYVMALCGLVGLATHAYAAGAMKAKSVTSALAQEGKSESNTQYLVTFVELGSVRCIPCKMMQPIMKDIEKEYGSQVRVVFYDVWTQEGRPYAEQYQVHGIPTQVFLDKDGREFLRHVGFFPKAELIKVLQSRGVK